MRRILLISIIAVVGVFLFSNPPEPVTAMYEMGKEVGIGAEGLIIELPNQGEYGVVQKSKIGWSIKNDENLIFIDAPGKRTADLTLVITNSEYPEKKYFIKLKVDPNTDYEMLKINDLSEIVQEDKVKEVAPVIRKEEAKVEKTQKKLVLTKDQFEKYKKTPKVEKVSEPVKKEVKTEPLKEEEKVVVEEEKEIKPIPGIQKIVEKRLEVKENLKKTEPVKKEKQAIVEEEIVEAAKENKTEDVKVTPVKKNKFDFDTFFTLSGGTQSFQDSSFAMEGEIIVAGKNESGLFFQGAGKTVINDMLKQYGFSVGAGFEPGKLGFFLFGDLLLHKFGDEFNSTTHFQLRPSARYRLSDKVHIAGFFAIPLGAWQFSGIEVPGEPGFGFYNKSLSHAGLDLSVYMTKMFVDVRALIAEGSAFGIDLKAGYEIIKKIFVTINYMYQTTGDYDFMEGITNTSRIGLGVTFNMRNFENRQKDRIIYRPDYPMIVVGKKEMEGEETTDVTPEVTLSGTPTTGYAPLNVSYEAKTKGFQGPVELTWYFTQTYTSTNSNKDSAFVYSVPGSYECYVDAADEFGNTATSNIVIVTVMDVTTEEGEFSITSSVTAGTGTISPEGTTIVQYDENQKFTMTPGDGWYISKVLVDGKSVGAVTEYTFVKVSSDHTISVDFTESPPETYIVTASSQTGGEISPDNEITVTAGDSITFSLTPNTGFELDKLLVGGSQVTVTGNTYTLSNIQENTTVEAFWKLKTYTVTGSVRNGQYGSIDPVSAEVEHGSDCSITFSPDATYRTARYWVNGIQTNDEDSTGITIGDVQSNQTVEVEFEKITYDVRVRLFLADARTEGHVDPGVGTFTYDAGSNLTFNFIVDNAVTEINQVLVNGNNKGDITTFKINSLAGDENIDVYMHRPQIALPVNVEGCGVNVQGSNGQSGVNRNYTVRKGDDLTLTFTPTDTTTNDYYLGVRDDGVRKAMVLPPTYTFNYITVNTNYAQIKCVAPGDPPPFAP